jgi:hypothetical protein
MLSFSALANLKQRIVQGNVYISTVLKGLTCAVSSAFSEFKWHEERVNIINRSLWDMCFIQQCSCPLQVKCPPLTAEYEILWFE